MTRQQKRDVARARVRVRVLAGINRVLRERDHERWRDPVELGPLLPTWACRINDEKGEGAWRTK